MLNVAMNFKHFSIIIFLSILVSCSSTYYAVWERLGFEKRDLLHSAIEDARDEQLETVEEFRDALEALRANFNMDNTKLQEFYERLRNEYEDAHAQANTLRGRIDNMNKLAMDLFDEWKQEAESIKTDSLRRQSLEQRSQTLQRYRRLHAAMTRSSREMAPVLQQLKDYVLFLKHNLNAQAIGSLRGEARNITNDMEKLTQRMSYSIKEIDSFLKHLEAPSRNRE
jgi:uncharacterized coiled-coil DUF342 family protein